MEAITRTQWQGMGNIVRFNWPFFAMGGAVMAGLAAAGLFLGWPWNLLAWMAAAAAFFSMAGSLTASWLIYDHSGLYDLPFAKGLPISAASRLVNINAGFDETSALLHACYPACFLEVFDFYDPQKHTESSIERARFAYPAFLAPK